MSQHSARTQTLTLNKDERSEDAFIKSFLEMLSVVRRIHDMNGDPNMRDMIQRAESALGRVPR